MCSGVANENLCLPCLDADCCEDGQNGEDYCNICWVEDLSSSPTVQLECGHKFHFICIKKKIDARWPTPMITFAFADCPLCHKPIDHPTLRPFLKPIRELEAHLKVKAVERLKIEGMLQDKALTDPTGRFYMKPEEYAISSFSYYLCYYCKSPYFGGKRDCGGEVNMGEFNIKELVCGPCSNINETTCKIHGDEFIEWKCRFCCSIATWFCGGKAHFCNPCHDKAAQLVEFTNWTTKPEYVEIPCKGPLECPIGVDHPPNGSKEFVLKCAMCRSNDHNLV